MQSAYVTGAIHLVPEALVNLEDVFIDVCSAPRYVAAGSASLIPFVLFQVLTFQRMCYVQATQFFSHFPLHY
jgi:hypothetical protein